MIDLCIMCGRHIPDGWDAVCPSCAIENHKVRESYLLEALKLVERERNALYLRIVNENRCESCIHCKECESKEGPSTFRQKRKNDSFCSQWEYNGECTPLDEIKRRGRIYVEHLRFGKMTLGKEEKV